MPLFFPNIDIDYTYDVVHGMRVRTLDFGNGYTQEFADGINNIRRVFTLSFSNRPTDLLYTITDFLDRQQGITPFYWRLPDAPNKTSDDLDKYDVLGVSRNINYSITGIRLGSLSFEFHERFTAESSNNG